MRTLAAVRRENLLELLKKYPSIADFNVAIGRDRYSPTVTQIKNESGKTTGRPRRMGTSFAREIERQLALPDGWMDEDHSVGVAYLEGEALPVFPMKTIALSGADPMSKETVYLDDDLFKRHYPDQKRADFVAAIIHDNSMSPTATPGDRVLIKPTTEFTTDGIYCVETQAGNLLRRIVFRLDGSHDVSADSRPNDVSKLEDLSIKIIGRVCMIWHASVV